MATKTVAKAVSKHSLARITLIAIIVFQINALFKTAPATQTIWKQKQLRKCFSSNPL